MFHSFKAFIQKASWNKRISYKNPTKIFFFWKIWKNLDWFLKKISRLLKSVSSVSVPNFKAVGRCKKPEIEPVLVMAIVLSHKHIDNGRGHMWNFIKNRKKNRNFFKKNRKFLCNKIGKIGILARKNRKIPFNKIRKIRIFTWKLRKIKGTFKWKKKK